MAGSFVDKLLESFDKLDHCISVTEDVLANKSDVPADVLARIKQYSKIVAKQRALANDLREHLDQQDWAEVSRHVKLINGLSTMIRDDAQEILAKGGEFAGEIADRFQLS